MAHSYVTQSSNNNLTEEILKLKGKKNLTWKQIAEGTKLSTVYVTAALLGQHPLPKKQAELVGKRLDLNLDQIEALQTIPMRGSIPEKIPTDPTIYRFYEVLQVYGSTLKSLIHEEFGDGIISAINFKLNIEKIEDSEGGYRALITLDGKFLPYNPF